MKKLMAIILAAVLLCAGLPVSADGGFTPIYEWTDEEWSYAMENWTDEQCYNYVNWIDNLGMEDYYDYYDNLYTAMNEWTDEQYDFHYHIYDKYYEYYWVMQIKETKKSLGFPYMEGLNVHVNGKFVTFSGTRGMVNERGISIVPMGDLAAALGAQYTYADGTGTMTLRGESVSFTAGEDAYIPTGYTSWVDYEYVQQYEVVTPYLDGSSLMVPLRLICNAFDLDLMWYSRYETAVVLDRVAIVSEINKSFTIINKLLGAIAEGRLTTPAGNTETEVKASLLGMLYGENDNTEANLKADISLIVSGSDISGEITLDSDADNLKDLLSLFFDYSYSYYYSYYSYYLDEIIDYIKTYVDGTHSIIVKGDEKAAYVKSALADASYPIAEGKWIRFELGEDYGTQDNGLIQNLLGETFDYTVGDYVYDNSYYYYYSSSYYFYSVYDMLMEETAVAAVFVGDKLFTGSGGKYSLSVNEQSIYNSLTAAGIYTGDEEYFNYYYDVSGLKYTLTFTEKNGEVADFDFDFTKKISDLVPGTLTIGASYTENGLSLDAAYVGSMLGKIVFSLDTTVKPGTKTVEAPPAQDVIDQSELIGTPSYDSEEDWAYYGWSDEAPVKDNVPEPDESPEET